jgi:hypothetical protein
MKKTLFPLLSLFTLWILPISVDALTVTTSPTLRTEMCDGGVFSTYVYETATGMHLYDVLNVFNGKEGII